MPIYLIVYWMQTVYSFGVKHIVEAIPTTMEESEKEIDKRASVLWGRNGISDRVLSLEEKRKWNEYRDHAEKYTLLESTVSQKLVDILTRLEARESFSENKLAAMEKISNVMDECMRLIKSLSIETNINVPSEMSNSFPHLPLVQKKA